MNDEDLRDLFAAFAMLNMTWKTGAEDEDAKECYTVADAMLRAKHAEKEIGITAAKPKRKRTL